MLVKINFQMGLEVAVGIVGIDGAPRLWSAMDACEACGCATMEAMEILP